MCSRFRVRERDILRSAQRLSLIYVSMAYRTAGYAALTAVTGLPSIDMIASMRRAAFLAKSQEYGPSKKVLLERLITEWQAWWDGCESASSVYPDSTGIQCWPVRFFTLCLLLRPSLLSPVWQTSINCVSGHILRFEEMKAFVEQCLERLPIVPIGTI